MWSREPVETAWLTNVVNVDIGHPGMADAPGVRQLETQSSGTSLFSPAYHQSEWTGQSSFRERTFYLGILTSVVQRPS